MRFAILVIATAAVLASAAQADPQQRQPGSGAVVDHRYVNDTLGITYPLPDGEWVANDGVAGSKFPNGTFLLLMADRHTGRRFFDRLLLIADDSSHYSNLGNARDYVRKLVGAQTKQKGVELVRDAYSMSVNDKEFFRSDYKQTEGDASIYKCYIAVRFRGWFLSWVFASESQEEVNHLADSVRASIFQNDSDDAGLDSAQAKLPASVVDKCPPINTDKFIEHPMRVRISQLVSDALVCRQVQPIYPPDARAKHIEGLVVLHIVIGQAGDVKQVKVVSGETSLTSSAVEAVQQWRYKPYLLNGKNVEVETQVTVDFRLH